jgi:hypothetical protein
MNYSSPSAELGNSYISYSEHASESTPGVRYRIARMSFARRLELVTKVRDIAQRTPTLLIAKGPESLTNEIARRIRQECHLSEDERKN